MDWPQPKGLPTVFAPGQAPRVAAPKAAPGAVPKSQPEPAKAEPPKAAPQPKAASKDKEPSPSETASAEAKQAASPPAGEKEEATAASPGASLALPFEVGTVVRIAGLKSAPQLNGTLAEVLRSSDVPDRIVVRCPGNGEKALRAGNLLASSADVLPAWAVPVLSVLAVSGLLCALGIYQGAASSICSAAIPGLAALMLLFTLLVCLLLYRPCWKPNTWLPSVSEVMNRAPSRTLFRGGVFGAALLLLLSNWLYGELILSQVLDGPMQPPAPAQDDGAVLEDEVEPAERVFSAEASQDDSSVENASDVEANISEEEAGNESDNSTVATKPRIPSPSLIRSSLMYGYVAPAALLAQATCFCNDRWLSTILHVIAALVFAMASSQHTSGCGLLLSSPRGRPHAELMGEFHIVAQARQMMADFAPIVAMGVPVTAQVFNTSRLTQQRASLSAMNFLETSGILLSLRALQWGMMLTYVLFVGSYVVDFWVISQNSLQGDEELV